jgi:hypothetical protein
MTQGTAIRSMQVEPFTAQHVPAVKQFNHRLVTAGAPWHYPEDPAPTWLPRADRSPLFQEYLLLTQGGHVRGGYVLKHQEAWLGGELVRIGCMYWLVSEGTVNKAYALVARELVQDAIRREPLLFGVGIQGLNAPLARLLGAMGWRLAVVPFHYKVANGYRFLRQIRYLRSTRLRSVALDLAAISGAGWVGAKLAGFLLTRRPERMPQVRVELVDEFGPWADELWRACRAHYSFLGVRDRVTLNSVFPRQARDLVRLKVTLDGTAVGLAVLKDSQDGGHQSFGDLRLGIIADCLADPQHADLVIQAAMSVLEHRGVDLLFSNQSHPAWCAALRRAGFLSGPPKCVLATSPRLGQRIAEIDGELRDIHVNRGDGDYPWGVAIGAGPEASAR